MGSLHFLDVGCGDATIAVTDDATFLIDCHSIESHSHILPRSKIIKALFITHQHSDHYSGMKYLRDNRYAIEYLIHSPYERRWSDTSVTLDEWNEFIAHKSYFESRGTKIYRPYRQESFDNPWWSLPEVKIWMLGPLRTTATSESRCLHDACLVFRADFGKRMCIFTGDASDKNLDDVATINNICDDILHASHHGSIEGASLTFIKKCNATYTVMSTASGRYDNVPHPTALRRYAENSTRVYRTDFDGSIKFTF